MAEPMDDVVVPQSEALPGQVPNSAGGFTWQVDDLRRLRRFLCLGSEGGSYYIGELKLGRENAKAILRLIARGRGEVVVQEIVDISVEGRAAKQDPIIFALALCARSDDAETKKAAYEALNKVCRIPTHLFSFVEFCESLSRQGTGWGRAHRRAICKWYNSKKPKDLAMAVTKYQNRNGWSHRDLFRLCHIEPDNVCVACVCKYVVKGMDQCREKCFEAGQEEVFEVLQFLEAVEEAKTADEYTVVKFIRENGLVREHVPSVHLNSKVVWATLLEHMPMTAMLRNLGKMSAVGLFGDQTHVAKVCGQLRDEAALQRARIHPFSVLQALYVYRMGHGVKGKLKWDINQNILQALDGAFYNTFKFVQPTGKRFLLAIDVSGSMESYNVLGSSCVSARTASAAMAMVTARTEANYHMVGFSGKLVPLDINARMKLNEVCAIIQAVPMGSTDCAQPMLYAKKKRLKVDVFIVYTDNETWAGKVHPAEALRQYRKATGIDARLIVCAMASNQFSLADPGDAGMLDIAGFDSAAPEVIRTFTLGEI